MTRVEIWDAAAWETYQAEQEPLFADVSEEVLPGHLLTASTDRTARRTARSPPARHRVPGAPSPAPETAPAARAGGDLAVRPGTLAPSTDTIGQTAGGSTTRASGIGAYATLGHVRSPASARGPEPVHAAAAHVPVLLDRVLDLLAPALEQAGAVVVDATLGLGGHAEALLAPLPAGPAGRARPRPAGAGSPRERLAPFGDRVDARARRLRRAARRCWRGWACARPRRAVRPRRLLAAARRGRPRLRLRAGRTAGHADGPDRRTDRRRRAQHLPGRPTWPGCCASTARSGSPGRSRPRSSASGERAAVQHRAPGWSSCVREAIPAPSRRTGGHPAKRTFQALRIEVNGELAVLERALPARGRRARRRRPDRRAVLPLARGPVVKRVLRDGATSTRAARPAGRAARARGRRCGCSPAAPRSRADEVAAQPAGRVGAAAGGRTDPGGGMSPAAAARLRGHDASCPAVRCRRRSRLRAVPRLARAGPAGRRSSSLVLLLLGGRAGRPARAQHRAPAGLVRADRPRARDDPVARPAGGSSPDEVAEASSSGHAGGPSDVGSAWCRTTTPCSSGLGPGGSRREGARSGGQPPGGATPSAAVTAGSATSTSGRACVGAATGGRRRRARGSERRPASRPARPSRGHDAPAPRGPARSGVGTRRSRRPARRAPRAAARAPRPRRRRSGAPRTRAAGRPASALARVASCSICVLLSLFAGRLVQLQGLDASTYAAASGTDDLRPVALPAMRGPILDRDGDAARPIAEAFHLTVDQTLVANPAAYAASARRPAAGRRRARSSGR